MSHCWEYELNYKLNKTFRSHDMIWGKKKEKKSFQIFSLQGCLPLSVISSCYSWPFYWLLQSPLLSSHCAVWESGRLKCSSVPLLLWSLFLKQHRIGRLWMAYGDIARKYTPFSHRGNHLRAYVFMCVSAYCLQSTKALQGSIQSIKNTVPLGDDGSF